MNKQEFENRVDKLLTEELKTPEKLCYMSFVDPDRPVGLKFLGGIFTMAHGVTDAIQKTHAMKINPGGEVLFAEMQIPFDLDKTLLDRLLTKDEVESI